MNARKELVGNYKEREIVRGLEKVQGRSNVFYWQAEREGDPAIIGKVWSDRHSPFSDEEINDAVNEALCDPDNTLTLNSLGNNGDLSFGNVNSVRAATYKGNEVLVRVHPKGVINGYFEVESIASTLARSAGVSSYETLAVGRGGEFDLQIITKLPGRLMQSELEDHPDKEKQILRAAGATMARVHQVEVEGFGPFDNAVAMGEGRLVGLHASFRQSVLAGLDFDCLELVKYKVLGRDQVPSIIKLYSEAAELDLVQQAVLVHNDFADWNLLTDGEKISGVVDWDECVAASPVSDLACWSTFFDPERIAEFLIGYTEQNQGLPSHYNELFELMRLRYTLSKMTLRVRRLSWDVEMRDFIMQKIESGKVRLADSMANLGLAS